MFCSIVLLLWLDQAKLSAQTTAQAQCFSIHVRLNGKLVTGPETVTFRTEQNESTASREGGCFRVPPELLTEKNVDVLFTVPGNKIHLVAISPAFFTDSWDVDLADKKFGRNVGLPKHARVREACAIVFHGGEPENAGVQTGCRSRLRTNSRKPGH
jgi:hypothetical protein